MGYKILVVEDTPDTRELLTLILTLAGYTVVEAADGQQGLEQAQSTLPDMILTDIRMPQMDGLEMVAHLRQKEAFAKTPILVMSAYGEEIQKAVSAGANGSLLKMLLPANIVPAVKRLLAA